MQIGVGGCQISMKKTLRRCTPTLLALREHRCKISRKKYYATHKCSLILTHEEECCVGDDDVERDVGVERKVLIENRLSQLRDQVATHREQNEREREWHTSGATSWQTHPVAADAPEASVLLLDRVICRRRHHAKVKLSCHGMIGASWCQMTNLT